MPKVAIVEIKNNNTEEAVRKVIQLLGGLKQFIGKSKNVLLKPNMLSAPKNKVKREMIITSPIVLEILSKMLLELEKEVVIGDSSGAGIEGGTRSVLEKSGYLRLKKIDERIDVRSLELKGPVVTDINGKKLKKANVSKDFLEFDSVINVPKMKTHGLTLYTGAIKNLFGTVCGDDKSRIHAMGATLEGFSQCLVDLFAFEKDKIKLNVMDAAIAVEGMGPGASGKPVEMNLILASDDAVALDAVAFTLMGGKPEKVPTIRLAAEQELGEINLDKIEIVGEKIEDHIKKFRMPKTAALGIIPFARFTEVQTRVPLYKEGCIFCLNCERACPQAVIKIIKTKSGEPKPIINLKGCISCFTCIEICPEACYKTRLKHRGKFIAIGLSILAIIALAITLGLTL